MLYQLFISDAGSGHGQSQHGDADGQSRGVESGHRTTVVSGQDAGQGGPEHTAGLQGWQSDEFQSVRRETIENISEKYNEQHYRVHQPAGVGI